MSCVPRWRCLAVSPDRLAELAQWWCGGDSAQAKPPFRRKKSASAIIPEGSKADSVTTQGLLRPSSSKQTLRLCTQEAQTTALWRIFGL